jgi:hypothetical protein
VEAEEAEIATASTAGATSTNRFRFT